MSSGFVQDPLLTKFLPHIPHKRTQDSYLSKSRGTKHLLGGAAT